MTSRILSSLRYPQELEVAYRESGYYRSLPYIHISHRKRLAYSSDVSSVLHSCYLYSPSQDKQDYQREKAFSRKPPVLKFGKTDQRATLSRANTWLTQGWQLPSQRTFTEFTVMSVCLVIALCLAYVTSADSSALQPPQAQYFKS